MPVERIIEYIIYAGQAACMQNFWQSLSTSLVVLFYSVSNIQIRVNSLLHKKLT